MGEALTPTDDPLITDLRAGKRGAHRAIYQRCFGKVRRYFLNKACQPADVEDLVSRVFVIVLDPKTRIVEAQNAAAYVMGIARNTWFAYLKERARLREVAPDEAGLEAFEHYVEAQGLSLHRLGAGQTTLLERDRELRKLLNGLRELPAVYQDVLELHYWEGMTFVDLAQVLGVPVGTANSRVRLAKARLYKLMTNVTVSPDDTRFDEIVAQVDEWARRVATKVRGASPD